MTNRRVSPEQCKAIGELPLPVAWDRVRLYGDKCGSVPGALRRAILWLSRDRAVALGNHVFLPARCQDDVAVLAHELTHCAQYQSWGPVRYYVRGAAAQIRDFAHRRFGLGRSPYAYQPSDARRFRDYGMEQQAQIVEDALRGNAVARAIARVELS